MKVFKLLIVISFMCVLLTGCPGTNSVIRHKIQVSAYEEKVLKLDSLLDLNLNNESGNIDVYTWDKHELKFEMTKKIRGASEKSELEKKLGDFSINITNNGSCVFFTAGYKGNMKNQIDRAVDLKIYVPKRIKAMNLKLDLGNVKFLDDIKGDIKGDINMANMDVNKLEGQVDLKFNVGSIGIQSGKIMNGSTVKIKVGNVYIKSEFEEKGNYFFDTGTGNIDLKLPAKSAVTIESIGLLEANEFSAQAYPARIRLSSGMGKISATKYQ